MTSANETTLPRFLRRSTRCTNWHYRYDALSADDVLSMKQLAKIAQQLSSSMYTVSQHLLLVTGILAMHQHATRSNYSKRLFLLWALFNAQFIGLLCCLQQTEDELDDIHFTNAEKRRLKAFGPPMNRRIADLDDEWAYHYTRFSKEQLLHLKWHLHIPDIFHYSTDACHYYSESGEAVMLVSLAYLTTGFYTYELIPLLFGGDPRPWG